MFLLFIGVVVLIVGVMSEIIGVSVLGGLLALLGAIILIRQKTTFAVFLTTSGGEIRAVQSNNGPFVRDVVNALNESIMSHS